MRRLTGTSSHSSDVIDTEYGVEFGTRVSLDADRTEVVDALSEEGLISADEFAAVWYRWDRRGVVERGNEVEHTVNRYSVSTWHRRSLEDVAAGLLGGLGNLVLVHDPWLSESVHPDDWDGRLKEAPPSPSNE